MTDMEAPGRRIVWAYTKIERIRFRLTMLLMRRSLFEMRKQHRFEVMMGLSLGKEFAPEESVTDSL